MPPWRNWLEPERKLVQMVKSKRLDKVRQFLVSLHANGHFHLKKVVQTAMSFLVKTDDTTKHARLLWNSLKELGRTLGDELDQLITQIIWDVLNIAIRAGKHGQATWLYDEVKIRYADNPERLRQMQANLRQLLLDIQSNLALPLPEANEKEKREAARIKRVKVSGGFGR
jgi:hypothetical protein